MRVAIIIILLFFCKAAELRKASPGGARNRVNHGRAGGSRKSSNPVKRYAPGLACEVYTYLHEKYLDCQERKLVYVLPDWPQDLLHMLLARNKIRILKNSMFSKFKKLKSLDLQQNEISKIESEAFFGLNKLTTLLLQHNQIKVLTEEVFIYTPLLSYLRLYDNPWHCTCEMETLISMLQIPRNRNLGNYAKCESPQELKNKKLRQIKSEQLCNEEESEQLEPRPQLSGKPPVIKTEVDSTLCHNYVFPIQTLDCRRKELKKVPNNIPPDIVKLDLSHNKINQLRPKEFEDVHELKKLNLSSNGIQFIDPDAGSCDDQSTKHGREELPHVGGQGQKLGGPDSQRAAARRSYPTSEVRGSSQECQAATVQERSRGATSCPRSGAAAGRSYPTPLRPRPGATAGRSNPTPEARGGGREDQPHVQGALAARAQEGLEELSHVEGQEGRW